MKSEEYDIPGSFIPNEAGLENREGDFGFRQFRFWKWIECGLDMVVDQWYFVVESGGSMDKGKKCGVYRFIDDELPFEYYKELFYKLHMENKELRSKLKHLSSQECAHNNSAPKNPSQEVPIEVILKEFNALKSQV
ncbi:hypothetical protein Tco_0016513 [Tanacetum coccineum]